MDCVYFTFPLTLSRGAGIGGLGITVEGPSESKINCRDNKNGSCSAEYIPFAPGDYDVNITYGGVHIPGKCLLDSRENNRFYMKTDLVLLIFQIFVTASRGEIPLHFYLQGCRIPVELVK